MLPKVVAVLPLVVVAALSAPQMVTDPPPLSQQCQECRKIGLAATKLYGSGEAVEEQVNLIMESDICPTLLDDHAYNDCFTDIPEQWPYIASGLFGSEGYWAPENHCVDLGCNFEDEVSEEEVDSLAVSCETCLGRLDGGLAYMVKPEVISELVYDMQFQTFCPQAVEDTVEKQRDCAEKVILTMPRILEALTNYPNASALHSQFCEEALECYYEF